MDRSKIVFPLNNIRGERRTGIRDRGLCSDRAGVNQRRGACIKGEGCRGWPIRRTGSHRHQADPPSSCPRPYQSTAPVVPVSKDRGLQGFIQLLRPSHPIRSPLSRPAGTSEMPPENREGSIEFRCPPFQQPNQRTHHEIQPFHTPAPCLSLRRSGHGSPARHCCRGCDVDRCQ